MVCMDGAGSFSYTSLIGAQWETLFFRLLVISYSSTLHLSLMLFGHINATLEASGNHLDT